MPTAEDQGSRAKETVHQGAQPSCASGARLAESCKVLGLSPRTVQRWRQDGAVKTDGRKAGAQGRIPANRLAEAERAEILATANALRFAHLPPQPDRSAARR